MKDLMLTVRYYDRTLLSPPKQTWDRADRCSPSFGMTGYGSPHSLLACHAINHDHLLGDNYE